MVGFYFWIYGQIWLFLILDYRFWHRIIGRHNASHFELFGRRHEDRQAHYQICDTTWSYNQYGWLFFNKYKF